MQLNMQMIEMVTDPELFKTTLRRVLRQHEAQKKAKRDHYHRNKEAINEKRRLAYASKKEDAAEGVSPGVVEPGVVQGV